MNNIYWHDEKKRILRVDLHGTIPPDDLNAILDELGDIVEGSNEPLYLLFDSATLNVSSMATTTAFSNRSGTRFLRHPNAKLIASTTNSPVLQYLGKFFAGNRLIIAKTLDEAVSKLEARMHEISAA